MSVLEPTWARFGPENLQGRIFIDSGSFLVDFGWILEEFWINMGSAAPRQLCRACWIRISHQHWPESASPLTPSVAHVNPNGRQNRPFEFFFGIKFLAWFLACLFSNFMRFLIDFGSHFGCFLASFLHHFCITFSRPVFGWFFKVSDPIFEPREPWNYQKSIVFLHQALFAHDHFFKDFPSQIA